MTAVDGIAIAVTDTAVTRPLAFTVNAGTPAFVPNEPTVLFTVARVIGIDAFAVPSKAADVPVASPVAENVRPVARAVAVDEFPETVALIEPAVIEPVTTSEPSVPTDVSDDVTTFEASVVPVRVPAAAATVMSAVPLNDTPLMFRAF